MKISNLAKLALLLAILAGPALAASVAYPAPKTLAVIYDVGDEPDSGVFSRIVAGIEDTPDVVVYRVALKSGLMDLAAVTPTSRSVQLAANTQGSIAVIYPDIGEPYRSIFTKIIEGIEDKAKTRVASFPIGANQNTQDLAGELRRQNVQVVIALGRNGLKAAAGLDRDIGIVAGGVLSVPEADVRGMSVFSLAPDPAMLFERLRALMPSIKRVFVAYDPRQNAWLIRLAREAARNQGIELVAQEAGDLKTAMRIYQESMASADPKKDALWLPQDSVTVEESSVLPFVLQEAWTHALVVFSSNVSHVKRGVLFSLYPNNVELGRNLASSALGQISSGRQSPAITPLKDVLMAINVRTAAHLGVSIGQRQLQAYDMVYPEP
ncbi:MAG: hypothetical protein KGZ83_22055 [Sulfuricella sp.]|nr:hypothetical protein [Sulfuricella sp.]